ncbi:phosphomannomutase [Salipiger marinus]|uniref:Phosphomannomutase n=1 Tax=Salipiger marinus TaxID=555512 RepID=A0A1G8QL22_9RHOB|nr:MULTISPECIES: phosphomannomutase [Salipiger]MEB3421103.1 phosphomannomutase [Salipiger manganoxidans]SDJ04790.1 phosphomannomutase [Salipiger marinus]
MAPKFGTSGLRGLVTELTPALVEDHVRAFLAACDTGGAICLGWDLRPSSPRIAQDVIRAAASMDVAVIDCGAVPTPALALAAQARGAGAVMITGSHIPADRNGLKFYVRSGEITKEDEAAITAALGTTPRTDTAPETQADPDCGARFVARYLQACGTGALRGRRIGLYSHSAVGRDLMAEILTGLGAEVVDLGRSDIFIPVDTEAVDPEVRAQIADWVAEHRLDALVSTDGDSDRPLLADETGAIVPGDIMGQITAAALGAETVVTPISSNSGVTAKGFAAVQRTRIGSPFVIAAMEAAGGKVVGYEANGGFLLGFEAEGPKGSFAPLRTRDCVLPLVMALIAAGPGPLSARVAQEPPVVTLADRLQEVSQEASQPFVAALASDLEARATFLAALGGSEAAVDLTDGVRITLTDGRVVHVRPSGNAPELRLYVEAQDRAGAEALLQAGLAELRRRLG